jgi:hypothetical protein
MVAAQDAQIDTRGQQNRLSNSVLRDMSTFDDIVALFPDGLVDASQVLGDGFTLLDSDDKIRLVGVPLALLEWRFTDNGKFGEFVSIRLAQLDEAGINIVGRYIVNDGSTGIKDQLKDYSTTYGQNGGLIVRNGLRRSEYDYTDDKGATRPAVTYYLDLSA